MPNKNELKVVSNQVLWWNGIKWLVKETCSTEKKAITKMEEILSLNNA